MNENFNNDDQSRFAGPDYLDRLSLSQAVNKEFPKPDAILLDEVKEALLNEPHLVASEIQVEVKDQVVVLRGQVDNRSVKKKAEETVEKVEGLRDIFNFLTFNEFIDVGSEGLVKNQARSE